MFFRYVVAGVQIKVLMTCRCTPLPTCVFIPHTLHHRVQISNNDSRNLMPRLLTFLFAADFPNVHASLPVTTSTRIPVLSP
jgi:hypothetical protein